MLAGTAGVLAAALVRPVSVGAFTAPPAGPEKITGRGAGDFDFLTGEWKIKHRRFDTSGPNGKEERDGSATVRSVLGGMGSIEELRKGDGSIFGMGVRVWHPKEQLWADHWTAAEDGVVTPPQMGRFINNEGIFAATDEMDGKPAKVKAVWDKITPDSCRWYQIMSYDDGKSWEYGWYMDWTRAA